MFVYFVVVLQEALYNRLLCWTLTQSVLELCSVTHAERSEFKVTHLSHEFASEHVEVV